MESSRPATRRDLPDLAQLAREAIAELTPMRGGEVWARQSARTLPVEHELERALDDPNQLVLVGCLNNTAVGYAAVRIETLRDGALLAVIDDLYVHPEARSVGLGETMMDQIVAWAEDRGCIGIDSVALPGNRETKNFFESFGLVARAIVVHRPLNRGPESGHEKPKPKPRD